MMIIQFNPLQMNAMLREDDDFIDYFIKEIMPRHLPVYANMASLPQTPEMVRWGRRYAEHFGFKDPIYQIHFVVLMWKVGPDFFEFNPYKQIIADPDLSEEEKMKRCNLDPTFEQEDFAIRNSDNDYWHPQYLRNNILGVPYDDIEEQFLRGER